MISDEQIMAQIKSDIGDKIADITIQAPRRIHLHVKPENLNMALAYIKEKWAFTLMSTISGVDLGEQFEFIYHMANLYTNINVRIMTPRSDPKVPTTTGVIPGAILYERELQDMFGVVVEGIPDSRPLLLPDDWPQGEYPLRKDWKWERPVEVIPGGK